jgi:hypothetical protein
MRGSSSRHLLTTNECEGAERRGEENRRTLEKKERKGHTAEYSDST